MTLRELLNSSTNSFVGESKFTGEIYEEDDLLRELGENNDTEVYDGGIVIIDDAKYILYEMVPVSSKIKNT